MTIEFTLPDTLTTWQFKGLAHDAALRSGTLVDACVAAKDLMVEPLVPRFLREGDVVQIPVKVSNTSTGRLSGTVRFALADARTNDSRDGLIDGPREQAFDLAAGRVEAGGVHRAGRRRHRRAAVHCAARPRLGAAGGRRRGGAPARAAPARARHGDGAAHDPRPR